MKNDTLFKLTDELKAKLIGAVADKNVIDLIAKTKANDDSEGGTFKCIVSTDDQDRQGESVKQDGWDLTFYKANPVVLWAHDYSSLPIGVCTNIYVQGNQLIAEGKFAPASANPFAQQVRQLYDLGMVNTTSVGFIPKEFAEEEHGNRDYQTITKAELLEFSFVPVPANARATAVRALTVCEIKKLGLDRNFLKTKGIELSIKEAGEGDSCELDDGTPGILAIDPEDIDGPLVCIPAKSISVGKTEAIKTLKKDLSEEHDTHVKNHATHLETFKAAHATESKAKADGLKDIADMDCFKAYVADHDLENQRHSKVISKCVKDFVKAHDAADKTDKAAFEKSIGESVTVKAGKKISSATAEIIKEAMDHIMKGHTVLSEMVAEEAGEADAEGKNANFDTTSLKSKVEHSESFDQFLADREFWKTIDISVGKILRNFNRSSIDIPRRK